MSDLKKRFIGNRQVDGNKIVLLNSQPFRARNAADNADIDLFALNASNVLQFKVIPQLDPALTHSGNEYEIATVKYINDVVQGKTDAKDSVLALSGGINQSLTGTAPLIIDGITIPNGARVGLPDQTNAAQSGIYVNTVTAGNYTLTRAPDADESSEVTQGMWYRVVSGTVYSGYEIILTTPDPIVLDTTNLTFAKVASSLSLVAGDGLAKNGNTLSIDLAPIAGLESTNPGNDAGQLRAKVDQATLGIDKSTRLNNTTGAIEAKRPRKFKTTLTPTDILNGYVDLEYEASRDSVELRVLGAPDQFEDVDFTVNYTAGAGGVTRVTFAGPLVVGGANELIVGDYIEVTYESF